MIAEAEKIILLCPKNDEESVLILQIAAKAGLFVLESAQAHGARLELEPKLNERLRLVNQAAETVVIVEIPGVTAEAELRKVGWRVEIIDHHRYEGLDRMKSESSLEQFLAFFKITNEELLAWGFTPALVRGVGLMDKGWVWELRKAKLSTAEIKEVTAYYLGLLGEIGGLKAENMAEAKAAWAAREEVNGVFIVRSLREDVRIREALSIIIAEEFNEAPTVLVLEGTQRISLQDSDAALALHGAFGGYVFGQDRCWGFAPKLNQPAPSVSAILGVINSSHGISQGLQ